jgi:hypothetical protein
MQGGKLLHTLDESTKYKPTVLHDSGGSTGSSDEQTDMMRTDGWAGTEHQGLSSPPCDFLSVLPAPLAVKAAARSSGQYADGKRYITGEHLQKNAQVACQKFDSLTLNGQKFTEYTIGGYGMNVDTMKKKISEFVPLPPVALPIIFADDFMNFKHHFFQGLETLLGRKYLVNMTTAIKYSAKDDMKLLPSVKQLMLAGAKPDDTELTIFVKRVLCGTFGTVPTADGVQESEGLLVEANLWGFEYIEAGMWVDDANLKMWLHMNYSAFRIAWFNTFKSSGIPSFAADGVQDRFESTGEYIRGATATDQSATNANSKRQGELNELRDLMDSLKKERRTLQDSQARRGEERSTRRADRHGRRH